jgi:PAS domain S-box-containing protein
MATEPQGSRRRRVNGPPPIPEGTRAKDVVALQKAIAAFNRHTEKLQEAYDALQLRIAEINRELEQKNKALEVANRDLQSKIAEVERLRGDLDNVIESMGSGLLAVDTEGVCFTFNRAAEQALGRYRDEVLGRHCSAIMGKAASTLAPLLLDGQRHDHVELCISHSCGRDVYVKGSVSPLLDRAQQRIGSTFIFSDLTSHRLLEERARRADRMTALGELAAGVAHEMRNPLTTIRGYLQILPSMKQNPAFLEEFSENVIREIDRLARLTDDMLGMAKPISSDLEVHDFGDVADEVVRFLADRFASAGVEVQLRCDPLGSPVQIDRNRLKQVLMNLLINAIDAVESSGARVEVSLCRSSERLAVGEVVRPFVVCRIRDTGPGIPPADLERIFDPFFTTKPHGTGLGLAVSNRIMEEHGGFLRVESEEGAGTQFSLFLPMLNERVE